MIIAIFVAAALVGVAIVVVAVWCEKDFRRFDR